jgi:alkylation response protein AidB-like acyl-CoA dehydrogenase
VDFELSDDQRAILEAVDALLARHAGAERAIALAGKGAYDSELEAALVQAGFFDLAGGDDTGPLEAALLVEAVARAGGLVAVGAAALVAPLVLEDDAPGPIALAVAGSDAPVRFAAHARTLLVLDAYVARRVDLVSGDVEPVRSNFGYPMGRPREGLLAGGATLGRRSGARLRNAWRTALAVEMAGTLRAALDVTVDYVKGRRQFGRAIGSFQGVQHRLAQAHVMVEGARWLALEAAWQGCPEEGAAVAAAHAATAAHRVFGETHQFSGAMGFTHEHDLHVWSMRLQALRLELDGAAGHQRAAAAARWDPA